MKTSACYFYYWITPCQSRLFLGYPVYYPCCATNHLQQVLLLLDIISEDQGDWAVWFWRRISQDALSCGSGQRASEWFTGPTRSLPRMALRCLLSGDSSFLGGSSLAWPLHTSWLTPEWVIQERVWVKPGHQLQCLLSPNLGSDTSARFYWSQWPTLLNWGCGPHRDQQTGMVEGLLGGSLLLLFSFWRWVLSWRSQKTV